MESSLLLGVFSDVLSGPLARGKTPEANGNGILNRPYGERRLRIVRLTWSQRDRLLNLNDGQAQDDTSICMESLGGLVQRLRQMFPYWVCVMAFMRLL